MNRFIASAVAFAVVLSGLTAVSFATPQAAQAAGISCGQYECEASGVVITNPNNNNGGGGGGGVAFNPSKPINKPTQKVTYEYKSCISWTAAYPATGHSSSYPISYIDEKISTYSCLMTPYSAGQATSCPARGGIPAIGQYQQTTVLAGITNISGWMCYYPAGASKPVYKVTKNLICYISATNWWSYGGKSTDGGVGKFRTGEQLSTGTKTTAWNASNPSANCTGITLNFAGKTKTVNGVPQYGYYTQSYTTVRVAVTVSEMPAVWHAPIKTSVSSPISQNYVDPYTYSCMLNPALAAGINKGVSFDASDCAKAQGKWTCAANQVDIAGTHGATNLLRNGEWVTVTSRPFAVNGGGVRNITNPRFYMDAAGTPFKGTDPNASNQYFRLGDKNGNFLKFRTWYSDPNANLNKLVRFHWAGDPGKPFTLSEKYSFTADFLTYTSGGLGEGTTSSWVNDSAECDPATSNPGNVLRAVIGYNE